MNAVEIEQALSDFCLAPFDADEFPFAFLGCFDNKATAIKRLRAKGKDSTNATDIIAQTGETFVLQRNHIHIGVCNNDCNAVNTTLEKLRTSPATLKAKAKYILATDGKTVEAENLKNGDTLACDYAEMANNFGFFLPLAGISTLVEIKNSAMDIKATSRLNRLRGQIIKDNPEWGKAERAQQLNHFMARLIFCYFAEDTDIFNGSQLFTQTIAQMSAADGSNTHEVMGDIFRAMDTPIETRNLPPPLLGKEGRHEVTGWLRPWADAFPYVNGGLFSRNPNGLDEVPRFSRTGRTYLLHAGGLDWKSINPDIFGSMIQAIADDEERSRLGMHYTSVPNILKVLNPLFLDELRAELAACTVEGKPNHRRLLKLKNRISRIRVFDPACGSGNFLVIAYKELRVLEAEIHRLRNEPNQTSSITITNFRGIELRSFPAEIARLALVIAEFQCDVLYCGQKEALSRVLPLKKENWITCGNALRLDWLTLCPPTGTGVKLLGDDLFNTPLDQTEIDFENAGGETFICGNPPYKGSKWQTPEQKADMASAWVKHAKLAKTTDYVTGWIAKLLDYTDKVPDTVGAFVTTNSVCQGEQAAIWAIAFERGCEIRFAHTSFKWENLASYNAGVTVVVVGLGKKSNSIKRLYQNDLVQECSVISPYLVPNSLAFVQKLNEPIGEKAEMLFGNMPRDGGHLILNCSLAKKIKQEDAVASHFIKKFIGSEEFINGKLRYCLWIQDNEIEIAQQSNFIAQRLKLVTENRNLSEAISTRQFAKKPHRFVQIQGVATTHTIVVPRVSSENRTYLPCGLLPAGVIVSDRNFAMYDAPLWNLALLASRLHWVWIATVCGRLETRLSYSNTLGWNTFPVPRLTTQMKGDLTRAAENILLAREAHYPKTIADLYKQGEMPENLQAAHDENDEIVERIFIGRLFKNDTERLEKLFWLYTERVGKIQNNAKPQKLKKKKETTI